MKNILLVSLFLLGGLIMSQANAQTYKSAIGLRLGSPVSASFKTFLDEQNALEFFIGYRSNSSIDFNWINFGGAYQIHNPLDDVAENLSWYYGFGASVYIWNYGNSYSNDFDNTSTSFGLQGYIGLDYKFENTPVNLSLDWVPTFFINSYLGGFGAGYGALSVRYVFNE